MYRLLVLLTFCLTSCRPEPPAPSIVVTGDLHMGSYIFYDLTLHFSKPISSKASVHYSFHWQQTAAPFESGEAESTDLYNMPNSPQDSIMINTPFVGGEGYEYCNFRIIEITEQRKGVYNFVPDNSGQVPCAASKK